MRIGIISDIHGNYVALRTVLEHMGKVDALWCLGDFVGYGPQPNECIEAVCKLPHVSIPGNHDWGMMGRLDAQSFNHDARALLEWTHKVLTTPNLKYLEALPLHMTTLQSSFTLVHASPRDPMWEYLLDLFDAAECFPRFHSRYCFVGHTHVPLIFRDADGVVKAQVPEPGEAIPVNIRPYRGTADIGQNDSRMIINPGSVGQPRDGDPRSAYMMLEIPDNVVSGDWRATLTYHRVEYPIKETQDLMRQYGFPPRLVSRLEVGI